MAQKSAAVAIGLPVWSNTRTARAISPSQLPSSLTRYASPRFGKPGRRRGRRAEAIERSYSSNGAKIASSVATLKLLYSFVKFTQVRKGYSARQDNRATGKGFPHGLPSWLKRFFVGSAAPGGKPRAAFLRQAPVTQPARSPTAGVAWT